MPIGCKGICDRFVHIHGGKDSAYELGFKRCAECDLYLKHDGIKCPCCGYSLRTKRRHK